MIYIYEFGFGYRFFFEDIVGGIFFLGVLFLGVTIGRLNIEIEVLCGDRFYSLVILCNLKIYSY